jgi:hypothetical protein
VIKSIIFVNKNHLWHENRSAEYSDKLNARLELTQFNEDDMYSCVRRVLTAHIIQDCCFAVHCSNRNELSVLA